MTENTDHGGGEFRTLNGYREREKKRITFAMEDYLEMVYRLAGDGAPVRVGELARMLHVAPSSATKMISNLQENGCVDAHPYGYIAMTEYGRTLGAYLARRHDTVERFLRFLNGTDCELEQAEKIEHFIGDRTLASMERVLREGKMEGEA